jgi:hypothetical protein
MATTQTMGALEQLRDALATIPGIKTCKIGLEANITPDDYPIIRVVPSLARDGRALGRRDIDLLIYFGAPVQAFDDTPDAEGRTRMEKVYAELFEIEARVREQLTRHGGLYRETITDEDRLDTYKLMAVRCEVTG